MDASLYIWKHLTSHKFISSVFSLTEFEHPIPVLSAPPEGTKIKTEHQEMPVTLCSDVPVYRPATAVRNLYVPTSNCKTSKTKITINTSIN
jgi:hypothetical protein